MNFRRCLVCAAIGAALPVCSTHAQEAINTPAATQPAKGKVYLRQQLRFVRFGSDPSDLDRDIDQVTFLNRIALGLTGSLSLSLDVPLTYRDTDRPGPGNDDTHFGVNDLTLMAKWRFWQEDLGPVDTIRFAALAGLMIPTYDDDYSTDGFSPIIGGVMTTVLGRHGLNASARWTFTTDSRRDPVMPGQGKADLLNYDFAYLYRFAPEAYSETQTDAWYGVIELNGFYETNGDHQLLFSPGLMFEARTWAAEIGVQLPIAQDLDRRPEMDWALVVGLRFLF